MGKPVGGSMIEVGGTRLFVRRWGPDNGGPILFFHSLGPAASAALLGVGLGPLASAGFAIAAPDMPGFGESPPVPADEYAVPRLADLGVALADALGWQRFVLGGHSWGGAVAVHLAAARPERVRGLVLVDSGHIDYETAPNADRTVSLEQMAIDAEAARRRAPDRAGVARDLELEVDDPVVDAFLAGMTDDGAGGLISRTLGASRGAAMYHLMRSRQTEQWSPIAAAGIPTLLLLATVPDALRTENEAAAERFRAAIPNADVRLVDGASHSLITDMRDRFGAIVAAWLRQVG